MKTPNSYITPVDLNKLKGLKSGDFIAVALAQNGLEEHDGLIWKELLVTGEWPGNEGIPPLVITPGMLLMIAEAFNSGAVRHVDVPSAHTNDVTMNTGFVEKVELRTVFRSPK